MIRYIVITLLAIIFLLYVYTEIQDHKIKNLADKVSQHPTDVFEKVQDERKSNYEKDINRNNSLDGNTTYWVQ